MPRPRFQKLNPARQREILHVAGENFAAYGFEGASLNKIIADLGISKGVFYYNFDDKEDLFLTVVDYAWNVFLPDLAALEALDASTFWPTLAQVMHRARSIVRNNRWLAGVAGLIYNPPSGSAMAAVFAEKCAEARKRQAAVIHHGQALGVIRSDLPADLLFSLLAGANEAADRWIVEHWDTLSDGETERISEEVFVIFRRMLAVETSEIEVRP